MMKTHLKPLYLLADNQAISSAGLHYLLAMLLPESPIAVASSKANLAEQLLQQKEVGTESVVILDYVLFDFVSVDELLIFLRRFPNTRWIMFSNELSEGLIRRLSAEPMVSMILKDNSSEEIGAALRCAARGERFLCHQVVNLLLTPVSTLSDESPLTASEREILRMVSRGMSVKEIASERHSSVHTITSHKKNIFRKIGVNNVYEAMQYARRAGLADEDYSI